MSYDLTITQQNLGHLRAYGIELRGYAYSEFFFMSESDQALMVAALIKEHEEKALRKWYTAVMTFIWGA